MEDLGVVASLLNEPVKCWVLMKFDCTLTGLFRLLRIYGSRREASKLIIEVKSKCLETLKDGNMNPVHLLLCYSEISERGYFVESGKTLLDLSNQFRDLGSLSWAIKAQNPRALKMCHTSLRREAIEIWQLCLDQSRNQTGSVFVHPTWMVFGNLSTRIRDDGMARKQLYEKFEIDVTREEDKVERAARLLDDLRFIRLWDSFPRH